MLFVKSILFIYLICGILGSPMPQCVFECLQTFRDGHTRTVCFRNMNNGFVFGYQSNCEVLRISCIKHSLDKYQLVEQGICVGQAPSINPLQGAL
uniref:Secreted protein n=1 Tax=Megaselia scalaris TaxID=36166 RepID=T1H0C5_MEGSC